MRKTAAEHFFLTRHDLAQQRPAKHALSLVDRIFSKVAGAIHAQELTAGVRLPSVRDLSDRLSISRDTASRAYDKLVAHGLLESKRGSGFYVMPQDRRIARLDPSRTNFSGPADIGATKWRIRLNRPSPELKSRTGSGTFPESWLDQSALSDAVRAVARGSQKSLAEHGDLQGYLPLRQQIELKLQTLGITAPVEKIMLTSGATEALHLVVQSYLRSIGEVVLIEEPGPHLIRDRLLSSGLGWAAIPRLADGPDLEAVRAACVLHKPRFFFCSSVLQSPTGGHITPHKAFQLLHMAEEFDFTLVEDDTYGDLLPVSSNVPLTRLATLDQLERVIYIGSFSKTLAPGLRSGFLAADPERVEWMTTYRMLQCIAGSGLSERIVYRLLSQGKYRHHCEQLRRRLEAARPEVSEALLSSGLTIPSPSEAGLFIWADMGRGRDAFVIADRMLEQGHLVAPGPLFSGAAEHRSCLRFNVAETQGGLALTALKALLGQPTKLRR